MLSQTEQAFFVIADISGYTQFLSAVELDHAHDIIGDLMDTVVRRLRPTFRLQVRGRRRVRLCGRRQDRRLRAAGRRGGDLLRVPPSARTIRQATTCECEACRKNAGSRPQIRRPSRRIRQTKLAGREELAGRDVIVVHRLLKNDVGEKAYALYSAPFVQAMGVDANAQGLVAHLESIDMIGELPCWVRDLHEAWRREQDRQRNEVTRDKAGMVIPLEIAAARPRVWDYFTSRTCGRNGARWTAFARRRRPAAAAPASSIIACMAITSSSRRCLTGALTTT